MSFLHHQYHVTPDDVIEVSLDKRANIRLMNDIDFSLYRRGKPYRCRAVVAKASPVHLSAPYTGSWHVVIDLEGYRGSVGASLRVLSAAGSPTSAR